VQGTSLAVQIYEEIIKIKIGKFIDNIINKYKNLTNDIPEHKDSTETDISNLDIEYYICGVDQNENVKWNKISHVSRHPTNGNLVKIITESGKSIISTKSHNFLIKKDNKIIPITAKELSINTQIPVVKCIKYDMNNILYDSQKAQFITDYRKTSDKSNNYYILNELLGWFCGIYLVNGYINKNCISIISNTKLIETKCNMIAIMYNVNYKKFIYKNKYNKLIIRYDYNDKGFANLLKEFKTGTTKKIIPKFVYNSNINFIYNIIKGFIEVNNVNIADDIIIKIKSKSQQLIKSISYLLTYFNIHSNYYIKINEKNYCLDIIDENKIFLKNNNYNKCNIKFNKDIIWDKIISIEEIEDPKEYVYDLTIPNNETFMTSDLICVHNTLNTFHSTGSGVTGMRGVPRFREILSYTKNPIKPYMVIYFDKKYNTNKEYAFRIASSLKYTILNDIAEQLDIIYDPEPINLEQSYYNKDDIDKESVFILNNIINININNMPWLYRIVLSKESLVKNEINMLDIKTKFVKFWNAYYADISNLRKIEKNVLTKVLYGCIMSNYDSSDNLIIHFRFELSNVNNQILLILQDIILNKFNIKGNEKISKISKIDNQKYVSYDNELQKPNTDVSEWIIYTEGVDINLIRKYIGIDINRTYTNDIHIIYQTFGIEAARSSLINEFGIVFESNKINYTHIELLVDVMTNAGNITSIDRHGINRLDTDPMGRASFEKTVDQLLIAAAFNETDYLRSVSSRIMVGRCINGGTGICELLIDVDMIENSELDDTTEIKKTSTLFKEIKNSNLLNDLIKNINSDTKIYTPFS
jgi:hypothetical protein